MGTLRTAVEVLTLLAVAPIGQMSSGALAAQVGSHEVTLRRLLGRLRYAGLVEGREGRHGGWALARDPATVSFGDVHRALRSQEPASPAPLEGVLAEADDAFAGVLARYSVADLAARVSPGSRL